MSAPPRSTVPPIITTKSWQFHPVTTSTRYQATSSSLLELGGVRDSVNKEIQFTLNSQPQDSGILFSGIVNSVSLHGGTHVGPGVTIKLPVAFSGIFREGSLSLTTPSGCSEERISIESIVPYVLKHLPRGQITSGSTWTDSTAISTCNGSIPTAGVIVQTYRITGEGSAEGKDAILVTYTSRATSRGEGAQGQHQVRLASSTTGTAQLWINPNSGELIRSVDQATGTVSITASGQTQTFNQTTYTVITAIGQ